MQTLRTNVVGQADLAFQSNLYESGNPTRRWIHQRRHQWVIDRLQAHAPATQAIAFDCGVGCGTYSRMMSSMGLDVVAIDVNEDFVRAANEIGNVSAVVADVCDRATLPLKERAWIAVCSEVLEHVPDPAEALHNLYGALAPGGILVLTTPQKWSTTELTARLLKLKFIERIARAIYNEPVQELGHISLRTRAELKRSIANAGFDIVEEDVFSFYLPVIAEFGGQWGQRLLAACERQLRRSSMLSWAIWTQGYVLRRPG